MSATSAWLLSLVLCHAIANDQPIILSGSAWHPTGLELDAAITLRRDADDWTASFDVPLLGMRSFALGRVEVERGRLRSLSTESQAAKLDAGIREDWSRLEGTLVQGESSFRLVMSLDSNYESRSIPRPQTPKRPFPYRERPLVAHHRDGHQLAGTLTLPDVSRFGEGPYPAAVLISGGGREDRDCTALGHQFFLVLADSLTRRGIAVMRFDDRGVGGSRAGAATRVGKDSTSQELSTDTLAVVERLRSVAEIDADRIGLIGHSEGGLIAPLVHEIDPEIAFLVLLAGPCAPGAEVFRAQLEKQWRRAAQDQSAVDPLVDAFVDLQRLLADGASAAEVTGAISSAARHAVAAGIHHQVEPEERSAVAEAQFQIFAAPWWRFMFGYDPEDALAGTLCPILALNGTVDVQVDCEQNLGAIEAILEGEEDRVETIRYPGLNHLFQPAFAGSSDEYAKIEITMHQQVLDDIASWILRTMGDEPERHRSH